MKPFNLDRAIAGDPLVTRDGQSVSEFHYFKTHLDPRPCAAVIEGGDIIWVGVDGENFDQGLDLFMAPKKRTVWVNIMDGGPAAWYGSEHVASVAEHTYKVIARAVPIEIED